MDSDSPEVLPTEIWSCVGCKTPIMMEGKCTGCGKFIPFLKGIPDFLSKSENEFKREKWESHFKNLATGFDDIPERSDHQSKKFFESTQKTVESMIIDWADGVNVLEAGCGTGLLVSKWTSRFPIFGIDIVFSNLPLAKQRGIIPARADLENLPFPDNFFGGVLAIGIFQYFSDLKHVLKEIHRVLKPDGELICTTLNKDSWLRRLRLLMKRADKKLVTTTYQDQELISDFSSAGFESKQFAYHFFPTGITRICDRPSFLWSRGAPSFTIKAVKK